MSRIGNAPVSVPQGVTVVVSGGSYTAKGAKGEIIRQIPAGVKIELTGATAVVSVTNPDKKTKSLHGFVRAQLANDVVGVSRGWTKVLELSGVGFRAALSGSNLVLTVGFSHPVTLVPPAGIQYGVAENKITVSGVDKHVVGQAASDVRSVREPEPYKGKGIKYQGEHIRKKAGKSAKAVGGAPGGAAK